MIILSASQLNKTYGTDTIFDDVSFGVEKGDRIGIVGPNGAGKTTLLSILAGELEPTAGSVYIRSEYKLGYLKQKNQFLGDGTVLEEAQKQFGHLYDMEAEMDDLQHRMADHNAPTFAKDLERYTNLIEDYEKAGGYTYKSELNAVLQHMGFQEEDFGKSINTLSGGERTRLALSCMLLKKPEILMLDEPTNHLDLKMLDWLENYLKNYNGTIIVVSHDRYFLDRLVNRIFDVRNNTLEDYRGNYSQFLVKREERLEAKRREYEKQQKEIARQEEMIRRFKQHGTEHLAKRAASREKRLEHMELVDAPEAKQAKMKIGFDQNYKSGNDVILAEDLSKSFGSRKLFDHVKMDIKKGERICIIGDNGIGKTTLLKILIGQERPDDGYLRIGYNVDFGYYDQGQRLLDDNETVFGEMKNAYHLYTDTEMRNLLGRFLFRGDDVFKQVGSLSGGEKAKLSMLKLMLSGANTLVFDEPTNHLDIESKEVIENAMMEFPGTLIIVSHDRYLLTKIPERILELTPDGMVEYKGNFDYYLERQNAQAASANSNAAEVQSSRNSSNSRSKAEPSELDVTLSQVRSAEDDRQAKKAREAEERRRGRKLEELENRIHELEGLIADLQDEIADPDKSTDFEWMTKASQELASHEEEVGKLYDQWMELQVHC